MSELRVSPKAGLAISGVVAVSLVLFAAAVALRPSPPASRRGVGGDRTEYGKTISLAIGLTLVDECSCPGLPSAGEAAKSEVTRAWQEADDFGFVFDTGMTLSYEATTESADEFAKRMIDASLRDPDESGPIGRLVALRGTQVWVKDLDAHGPAFVEWLEDEREITLIGGDDQELSTLLSLAGSLT